MGNDDTPTWYALADVNPTTGTATLRRNLTVEEESFKWIKTGCSAFDSSSQLFWLIAGVGDSEAETVLGYDSKGSAAISVPFLTTYDAIALEFSAALGAPVALAYMRDSPKAVFSWLLMNSTDPSGWSVLFSYPEDTVFLSGMGEAALEDAGRIAAAVFEVRVSAKEVIDIVSLVDLVGGAEIERRNVTKKMVVADLSFCNA